MKMAVKRDDVVAAAAAVDADDDVYYEHGFIVKRLLAC